MPPVMSVDGRPVLLVRVPRGELTCTNCGEVTSEGWCQRCNGEGDDREFVKEEGRGHVRVSSVANLVPTVSYLREGEYVEV